MLGGQNPRDHKEASQRSGVHPHLKRPRRSRGRQPEVIGVGTPSGARPETTEKGETETPSQDLIERRGCKLYELRPVVKDEDVHNAFMHAWETCGSAKALGIVLEWCQTAMMQAILEELEDAAWEAENGPGELISLRVVDPAKLAAAHEEGGL